MASLGIGTLLMGAKALFEGPLVGSLILYYHLHPIISTYECILAGIALGYNFIAWLSFICCAISGGTSGTAVRISYTILTIIGLIYLKLISKRQNLNTVIQQFYREIRRETWLNTLLVVFGAYFFQVYYIHSLYEDENGSTWSGGSMWSDLCFHLNIINSYLYGQVRNNNSNKPKPKMHTN
jgi:hypothetical protein